MLAYLVRKFFLTISIVFGVMVVTFFLFNVVAKDPARAYAGKEKSEEQLRAVRAQMGLDKPKVALNFKAYHAATDHRLAALLDTQFFNIISFQFPQSMRYQESVWSLFRRKAAVSLAIQLPVFVIELGLQLAIALFVASRRNSAADYSVTVLAVFMMSLPSLSVYLGVQWFFGAYLKWFPVAGWGQGVLYAIHFAALPIIVSIAGGLGGPIRFYRTVALEEIGNDYVRTARAKGIGQTDVLLVHVLRNLMMPVVTNTIVAIPFLVTGALIMENIFQIPGFGGLLVQSIGGQDSPVLMAQIYLTSIAYAVMLFVTDICYTLVDPRVVLR
jgi:peptide/nickel transport system permease protein